MPEAVTELRTGYSVVRPEDLAVLTFTFRNLGRDPTNPLRLIRVNVNEPALIWVILPPQHVAEQAFFEDASPAFRVLPPRIAPVTDSTTETPTSPVRARLAGPSTLTFVIAAGPSAPVIELTLQGLLRACAGLPLLIAETATSWHGGTSDVFQQQRQIRRPTEETALELPFRLFLSPDENGRFTHASGPDEGKANGRVELWHTRLGVRGGSGPAGVDETDAGAASRLVRAIWSPDARPRPDDAPKPANLPFRMPLDAYDRHNIVHQSTWPSGAIAVRQLMLTALGAWIDVRGEWAKGRGLTVEEWNQRGTLGRDHFVRVVYAGYLYPFGHAASLVKVTERKFRQTANGVVAYLFQRMYVVVREPKRALGGPGAPSGGRSMPFKSLRITTLVTPDLSDPVKTQIGSYEQRAFWPQVAGKDFLFHMIGEDGEGRIAEFSAPLIFIGDDVATVRGDVMKAYDAPAAEERRRRPLRGQQVAFAPRNDKGDAVLETHTITFGGVVLPAGQPLFAPVVTAAQVGLPALRHLARLEQKTTIEYHATYLGNGFDPAMNKGEVFCKIKESDPISLSFSGQGDRAGGIAQPNMTITGLSRSHGPVAAVESVVKGSVDPSSYLDASATLFGGIALGEILLANPQGDLNKLPRIVTDPTGVRFTWNPDLRSSSIFEALIVVDSKPRPAKLTLSVDLKHEPASTRIAGTLENFTIHLAGVISVAFKEFLFVSENGRKPSVDVDLQNITFTGPLSFVELLKSEIPLDGFSDPPFVTCLANGIQAGYTLPIPSVELGMFALQNLSLGAVLTVPFDGDPLSLAFNFSTRENPFLLCVGGIGGGGFFGLVVKATGVQVEAALEFGACLALNLGVASGELHVMGGIYFKTDADVTKLGGYVRIGGSVSVLGLINASLDLNLSLTYDDGSKKLWGRAAMTVEIDLLFFSESVEIVVERRFAGNAADPPFRVMMGPHEVPGGKIINPWSDYCAAFA